MSLSEDADYPRCPSCKTNLLVARSNDNIHEWRCWGCRDVYHDGDMLGWYQ